MKRCSDVFSDPRLKEPHMLKLVNDFTQLAEKLIELCNKPIATCETVSFESKPKVTNLTLSTMVMIKFCNPLSYHTEGFSIGCVFFKDLLVHAAFLSTKCHQVALWPLATCFP